MNFSEIIKKVNSDKRLIPDLMKCEKGNNFRAVSEAAILDVINPVLNDNCIFYTVEIKDQKLEIKEAWGSKGRKLQFIATIVVKLNFYTDENEEFICSTESVGLGIDDNDKAMGKAYTYAVKYALLKLFRLQYGDDPDAKASEPLYPEKPKEKKVENENINDKSVDNAQKTKKSSSNKEKLMSEAQRDYILGMMKQKDVPNTTIMGKFDGYDPNYDEDIPMKVARAMIKFLEEYTPADDEELPF